MLSHRGIERAGQVRGIGYNAARMETPPGRSTSPTPVIPVLTYATSPPGCRIACEIRDEGIAFATYPMTRRSKWIITTTIIAMTGSIVVGLYCSTSHLDSSIQLWGVPLLLLMVAWVVAHRLDLENRPATLVLTKDDLSLKEVHEGHEINECWPRRRIVKIFAKSGETGANLTVLGSLIIVLDDGSEHRAFVNRSLRDLQWVERELNQSFAVSNDREKAAKLD